jgi:hypothetical protein
MAWGDKIDSSLGNKSGQYFIIGRVKHIVLGPYIASTKLPDQEYNNPSDLGKIKFELLYSSLSTSKSKEVSEPAYPMFSFLRQYPVVNEIVLILAGPTPELNERFTKQQFFYFPPYDLWNHVNHGAFPNMSEYSQFLNKTYNPAGYSGKATEGPKLPLGYTFTEKEEVRNIRPFEGDSVLQSRFGQSIRFGSTVPVMKSQNNWSNSGNNGDPITIITNRQGSRPGSDKMDPLVEDINKDGSCIYLTSTQEIDLEDINLFPLASYGTSIKAIIQNAIEIQRPAISDETISSQFQDENSIK